MDYQWERHTGGPKERWDLRAYNQLGDSAIIGTARKTKNNHRCRRWAVTFEVNYFKSIHVATLNDLKRREALDAARMLLILRHQDV